MSTSGYGCVRHTFTVVNVVLLVRIQRLWLRSAHLHNRQCCTSGTYIAAMAAFGTPSQSSMLYFWYVYSGYGCVRHTFTIVNVILLVRIRRLWLRSAHLHNRQCCTSGTYTAAMAAFGTPSQSSITSSQSFNYFLHNRQVLLVCIYYDEDPTN